MSANERQVGGSHYKQGGEEHWDRMWRLHGRGYFVGCITKYTERYHLKNGVQDLEKAKHFLEKLIELETAANTEVGKTPAVWELDPEIRLKSDGTHPHVKEVGSEVSATGWIGYTFEGADSQGFLYTCAACREKFYAPVNANPNLSHICKG